jgi:hypothetical protein
VEKNKTTCMNCSRENEPTRNICVECGAKLLPPIPDIFIRQQEAVRLYKRILIEFLEHHSLVEKQPPIFQNEKYKNTSQAYLNYLVALSGSIPSPESKNSIDLCQELVSATKNLRANYSPFLKTGRMEYLKVAIQFRNQLFEIIDSLVVSIASEKANYR